MANSWRGIYPAATTQFHADQSLDLKGTLEHVEKLIAAGMDGLIMLGSVGENTTLEYSEKLDVLKATIEQVRRRIPVLAGVAETTTRLACRFALDARKADVDGLMVLPAMIYKADPRETLTHFREVAWATDLPILVYNNPPAYGVDITPAMFAELADEKTLVAIKESSDNVRRITDIKNLCGDRYILFCGVDDLVLECTMLGSVGWVSGLVNAFPYESKRLWDLAMAGNYAEALKIYRWFTPLLHLDTHVKLVQYIKLAAAECGYGCEVTRAPRLALVGREREEILGIIRKALQTRPEI
jgi:dihydrodipicolinate synthase/N-acetylneuraminate lyase